MQYKVYCYYAAIKQQVTLKDSEGKLYTAPVIELQWKDDFHANVTFKFKGKTFTVLDEVSPKFVI